MHEARDALLDAVVNRPREWVIQSRQRLQDLPKTNFDLGCAFADQGKWLDAAFRFRVAAYFQPEYPQVWYNLGCSYFRAGKLAQAKSALHKAIAQAPGQPEALFMLATIDPASLNPNQRPDRMPASMVGDFFTSLAPRYDIEEARNKYQAGKMIHDLAKPLVKNPSPVVLDLACGTGIVARPWRAGATEIIGVDSTKAMVALADKATHVEKKLFERLIEADIRQLPASIADGSVDVALLVNAAQFVGELSGVMASVARILGPQGLLVLTVEPFNAAAGFGLSAQTGRFAHSPAYVKQMAQAVGLTCIKEASVMLYPDLPIPAFIFSKGGD